MGTVRHSSGRASSRNTWPPRVFSDRLDRAGHLRAVSDAEAQFLGYAASELVGLPASKLYDEISLTRLLQQLEVSGAEAAALPLTMIRADGSRVALLGIVAGNVEAGKSVLDVIKAPVPGPVGDQLDATQNNEILWSIIQRAREAIWCIRYDEPVDVTRAEDAVVDQIFGNACVWTMCNTAMAQIYDLRDETELNGRSVHVHWPRNAVNEAFIREVIAHDFQVEGAISEDYRRDGTPVLMENDVRAHVAGGRLYRLWGTLRELKSMPHQHADDRAAPSALGFDLLPLPACLLKSDGTSVAENVAWRLTFGSMSAIAIKMIFRSAAGKDFREFTLPLPHASGETHQHLITCRWQGATNRTPAVPGSAWLAVVTRRLDEQIGGGAA